MTRLARSARRASRARGLATFAALVALALPGCDAGEPILYEPRYEPGVEVPLPQSEFCPTLALETCAVLRPCCLASPYAFDEVKCRVDVRALCEARKVQAIADDARRFDPIQAARCARGVAALVRECRRALPADDLDAWWVDAACARVWHGDRAAGAACPSGADVECAAEAGRVIVCSSIHRCAPRTLLQVGEDCAPADAERCAEAVCGCAPGLSCRGSVGAGRCTAYPHLLGAPCGHDASQSGPVSVECGRDRYCDPAGICAELPGLGERCVRGTDADLCRSGLRCDVAKQRSCVEGKRLGSVCDADGECASAACLRHVCVPDDGLIATPAVCNGAVFTDVEPVHGFLSVPSFERSP